MKKDKILIIIGVFIMLVYELAIFGVICMPKKFNNNLIAYENTVYSEMITVKELIDSFNKELLNNNKNEINLEYLTVVDNTYYIGLFQDIILFITPINMKNIEEDIVYQMGIIIDNDSFNYDLALLYYRILAIANNEFLFDISYIINEVVTTEKTIDQNNGLLFTKISDSNDINFVIERKYKAS